MVCCYATWRIRHSPEATLGEPVCYNRVFLSAVSRQPFLVKQNLGNQVAVLLGQTPEYRRRLLDEAAGWG